MYHHIIDRNTVIVAPLNGTIFCLPNLDPAILRTGHHPFTLAMESDASYISRVTSEDHHRRRIRRANVKKLDIMVAGSGEVTLVWGDA